MAIRKPRTNNAIKAQARAHQKANPGTTYTAAREAVLRADTPATGRYPALDSIVGQPAAKKTLRALFDAHQVRTERARREHVARWANSEPHVRPPFIAPRATPKVHIFGPSGSGKTKVSYAIYDELILPASKGKTRPPRLVQVSARQLVGRYHGDAQSRIQPLVESAEGGMLVIEDGDFLIGHDAVSRDEALTVLSEEIRLIEHDLAVCFISYAASAKSEEGARFLRALTVKVPMGSVNGDTAAELSARFARDNGVSLTDAALDLITRRVEEFEVHDAGGYPSIDVAGNARFVRSVVELAEHNLAQRMSSRNLKDVTDAELTTVTDEDVRAALEIATK